MPPSEKNLIRFLLVLYTNFQLFGNNGRKNRMCIRSLTSWTKFLAASLAAWVRLNCLRTGVERFCFCLHKWGMAASAACEGDAEDQIVECVVFPYPIHRPPHGLHGLIWMVRQLIGCSTPALRSNAAKHWTERTGSNDDVEAACACVL